MEGWLKAKWNNDERSGLEAFVGRDGEAYPDVADASLDQSPMRPKSDCATVFD